MLALISFIFAVFPIVIIHEFGHFLVGKYLGAEPEEFSVGFGKSLVNFQWLGANFKIGWIPLGGYVKFKKMQFDVEFGENGKKGEKIAPWKWFFISIAGPASNFVLTFLIFFGFMMTAFNSIQSGEVKSSQIEQVKVGDKILVVSESSASNFIKKNMLEESKGNVFVKSNDKITALNMEAKDLQGKVDVTLGDSMTVVEKVSRSTEASITMILGAVKGTTVALINLASPNGYKGMMGPIGIAGEANKARESGIISFLFLIASLSFAIGYFNLLPLTFLDGGRAILALLEEATKKSIKEKTLGRLNMFGFYIIILLMGMSFFSDIMRLMGK